MNQVFIDMRKENEIISSQFDADMVSIEQILNKFEDLVVEMEYIKEMIHDMETPNEKEWVMADVRYEERNN